MSDFIQKHIANLDELEITCLPGWACERQMDTWLGREVRTITHSQQAPALLNEDQAFSMPQKRWALVTWSMGSWSGWLWSRHWGSQPPEFWIALSPFADFTGEEARVSAQALELLHDSFSHDPHRTLKLFQKTHRAGCAWVDDQLIDKHRETFTKTLGRLAEPAPTPESALTVPLLVILGDKDRLVNEKSASAFASHFSNSEVHTLEGMGHATFYEEPQVLRELLAWS